MATINISNLNSIGSDLFTDTESYLQDLSESELNAQGGLYISTITSTITITRDYFTL
jgi:hypothetical protein